MMDTVLQPVEAGEVRTPAAPIPERPISFVAEALRNGITDVAVLKELVALQNGERAEEARKSYLAAMARAKAEFGPVLRTSENDHTKKKYAGLAAHQSAVDAALAAHGLSYRFWTEDTDRGVVPVFELRHEDGHTETTRLSASARWEGNKSVNDIQKYGGTQTFLFRYAMASALGLAPSDDRDGSTVPQSEYDLPRALDRIRATETQDELTVLQREIRNGGGPSFGQIPRDLVPSLVTAWKARRGELENAE